MKQIFTLVLLSLVNYTFSQDCDGRYQADIYTDFEIDTVKFGAAVNDAGTSQDLFMDVYQPIGDISTAERPLIIIAFGGSFIGGDRHTGDMTFMAESFVKKGYICATIDYRLASNLFNFGQEEYVVKTVFRAVQDGKAAIRYFRQDAVDGSNEYRIDTNNIFIGGTSAGGILAVNLAYVDDISKLPANWQTWANDIGGIEGDSGNRGYCSKPNGVFSFAGAVGDTSYIEPNDIPHFGSHSTGDMTVRYDFGPPLDNPVLTVPVSLYGSGDVNTRMDNLGIYNELYTYNGSSHPPFQGDVPIETTKNNLTDFLYNIVTCNPNNQRKVDQEDCKSFVDPGPISSIIESKNSNFVRVFPNPTNGGISITHKENVSISAVEIMDMIGTTIFSKSVNSSTIQLSLEELNTGTYIINLIDRNGESTSQLLLKQ